MANTTNKKYLTDENGDKFYPIGHVDAIYTDDGSTLFPSNGYAALSELTLDAHDMAYTMWSENYGDDYVGVSEAINGLISDKAPNSHASNTTTYGVGNSSDYGHLKLSDSASSTSGVSGGIAATPYAVKQAYDRITANYVNSYGTSGSWKAVYTNGGATFSNEKFGDDDGTVVLEGMGSTKTKFTFDFSTYIDPIDGSRYIWYEHGKTIIIKDATVELIFSDTAVATNANFVFINCEVLSHERDTEGVEIYNGSGNITFINSRITQTERDYYNTNEYPQCYSGIMTDSDVTIIGGSVSIVAGGTTDGFDSNFIYSCNKLTMQGVTIKTSGNSTGRINLIRNCNNPTVNGCHIYLNGTMHSIGHIADTDRTVGGSFTGNYVEYYGTYMRFGTISGNTFNHLAAGSSSANQIVLQCPTNMSGNTFKGSAAYVDAQSQKVIVDRNLHDNGLTVGSTASGSITSNNLQY